MKIKNNAFEEFVLEKKKKTLPHTIQNMVIDLNVNVKTIRVSYSNTEHNGKGKFI